MTGHVTYSDLYLVHTPVVRVVVVLTVLAEWALARILMTTAIVEVLRGCRDNHTVVLDRRWSLTGDKQGARSEICIHMTPHFDHLEHVCSRWTCG